MFNRIKLFLLESRQEFEHINWPDGKQTINLVVIVIGISVAVSLFLGTFDFIFDSAWKQVLIK
jgi:preprotein translocase SecE subunit